MINQNKMYYKLIQSSQWMDKFWSTGLWDAVYYAVRSCCI